MSSKYNLKPYGINQKSFYGKARVKVLDDGTAVLTSYHTQVCKILPSGEVVRTWGGYSATTMRHVKAFLNERGVMGGGKAWWDKLAVAQ